MALSWLPLDGIRVVDFSMFVPGPFASSILADLGAEVIKVEALKGDPGRVYVPVQFHTENRNKRGIAMDLKNAESRQIIERLIAQADIALEGFRPGVAKRLGIDYETLRKYNPKLIYCSFSGYGQHGPWSGHPGHDVNYLAAAGGLAFPGHWLKPPGRSSLPVADMAGGSFAAISVLAALHDRAKTGKGAYLDLSMLESAFFMAAQRHGLDSSVDPKAHLFPVNDLFECADGKRIALGVLEEHFWENFRKCAPGFESEKYATDSSRRKHGDELSGTLQEVFLAKTSTEWKALLEANDVPADLCLTTAEAAELPQLKERKAVSGKHALFPVWANGARGGRIRSGVPKLGEHTREVLVELGFDDAEVAGFIRSGAVRAG
jgi:crotonobetainyl-CoA:carnitine CoA-transferase CaiB-like acyl-CoA transferase